MKSFETNVDKKLTSTCFKVLQGIKFVEGNRFYAYSFMAAEGSSHLILLNGTKVAGLAITRMIALSLPGGALPEMKLGDLRNMRNNWANSPSFFHRGRE